MVLDLLHGFGKTTTKHAKAGLPKKPCIKVKRGAGTVFGEIFFDPVTLFNIEVGTIVSRDEPKVHKLKRRKSKTYCLYAGKGRCR